MMRLFGDHKVINIGVPTKFFEIYDVISRLESFLLCDRPFCHPNNTREIMMKGGAEMDNIFCRKSPEMVTCAWQLFLAMGPAERVQGKVDLLRNKDNSVNVYSPCTVIRMQPIIRRDAYG